MSLDLKSVAPVPYPSILELKVSNPPKDSSILEILVKCDIAWSRKFIISDANCNSIKLFVPSTVNLWASCTSNSRATIELISVSKIPLGVTIHQLQVDPENTNLMTSMHQSLPPFSSSNILVVPDNNKFSLCEWINTRHIYSLFGIQGTRLSWNGPAMDSKLATSLWQQDEVEILTNILPLLMETCGMSNLLCNLMTKIQSRILIMSDDRIPNVNMSIPLLEHKQLEWRQRLHHTSVQAQCKGQDIVFDTKVLSISKETVKKLVVSLGKALISRYKTSGGKIKPMDQWSELWDWLQIALDVPKNGNYNLFCKVDFNNDQNYDRSKCNCCRFFQIGFLYPILEVGMDAKELNHHLQNNIIMPLIEQTYYDNLQKILLITSKQLNELSIATLKMLMDENWSVIVATKDNIQTLYIIKASQFQCPISTIIVISNFNDFKEWNENKRTIESCVGKKFGWNDGDLSLLFTQPYLYSVDEIGHISPMMADKRRSGTKKQRSSISLQ